MPVIQKTFTNRTEVIQNKRHTAKQVLRTIYKKDGTTAKVVRPSVLTVQAVRKRKAQEHARQRLTTNRGLLRSIMRSLGF